MVHQVGAGVHGPVFLGTDPTGDRQVAIKTYPLDITPERAASLAAALDRLVSVPLGHPSIVSLLAAGSEGSTVYLVQEYVLAESVDTAIRQYGPAPVPDALRLIGQLAGALDFAAVAGVHHGALHPRDVLVAPHDVRLTGLGVAEAFEQVGLRVTSRRPYAAPERQERQPWGTPADVFSLAAVGFEMLTGRRPGSVEALAADTRSIPSPEPAALAEVFARALSSRPSDRFQTALAFAAALRHALTGEPIERPDVAPLVAAAPREAGDDIDTAPDVGARVPEVGGVVSGVEPIAPPATGAEAPAPATSVEPEPVPLEPEPVPLEPEPVPLEPEPAPLEAEAAQPEPEPARLEPEPRAEPAAAPEGLPPELAVFAPGTGEDEPVPAVAAEPEGDFEAAAIDEFRGDTDIAHDEAPVGPRELGEEEEIGTRAETAGYVEAVERGEAVEPVEAVDDAVEPADMTPLLPLEAGPEPPRVEEPWRPVPPPVAEPPAFRRAPAPEPRPEPPAFRRPPAPPRFRFPLSSLLAMLLLGIVAGFVGGYVVGRREPGTPERSSQTGAAVPADAAGPRSDVPPQETSPRTQEAGAKPSQPAAAAPRAVAPPPPPRDAAVRSQPREAPSRAAPRRPAPADRDDEAGEARFEAPLSVVSRPEGALVRLDGRAVGKTPLRLRAIGAGSHVIRLELAGYLPWTSAIQVVSGTQNRVTASLERRPGSSE